MFLLQKNYQLKLDEKLKERFFNTNKFFNNDNSRIILLLQKHVYPYEYMDDWEKFDETLLREKGDIYSHLYMEDISDADYAHAKRVCKDFEIKNLWRMSWFASSKRYIIVSRCIWEF